jgi:uncharacterized membrane protein
MDSVPIQVLFRILHVGTAIVLVGGSIFLRFVLMPAASSLPDAEHEALRERLVGRWKLFVHIGVALLLVTGLYNYLLVTQPLHKGEGHALYHALLGTKMLLAFILFFLASVMVGKAKVFEKLRTGSHTTLLIMTLLALVIVSISGYVKVRPWPLSTPTETAAPSPEEEAK